MSRKDDFTNGLWIAGVAIGAIAFFTKMFSGSDTNNETSETYERHDYSPPIHYYGTFHEPGMETIVTKKEFNEIVKEVQSANSTVRKRVTSLSTENAKVFGTVESTSGLTSWTFKLDFADNGHLTGRFQMNSGNEDSPIPEFIGNAISDRIYSVYQKKKQEYSEQYRNNDTYRYYSEEDTEGYQDKDTAREDWELLNAMKEDNRSYRANNEYNSTPVVVRGSAKTVMFLLILAIMLIGTFSYLVYKDNMSEAKPLLISSNKVEDMNYQKLESQLRKNGFYNVVSEPMEDLPLSEKEREESVYRIKLNRFYAPSRSFDTDQMYPCDKKIIIQYHSLKQVSPPVSSTDLEEKHDSEDLRARFEENGFVNIKMDPQEDLITGWVKDDGQVISVTIGSKNEFSSSDDFDPDVEVVISYHSFKKK